MDKIIDFLNELFELEQRVLEAGNYKSRFEEYNDIVSQMAMFSDNVTIGLGYPVLKKPKPDFFYEEADANANARNIYKISHYQDSTGESLWACYISGVNPSPGVFMMGKVFFIKELNGKLMLVADFFRNHETSEWGYAGGEESFIDLLRKGKPIEVHRLLSSNSDEWSASEYDADK